MASLKNIFDAVCSLSIKGPYFSSFRLSERLFRSLELITLLLYKLSTDLINLVISALLVSFKIWSISNNFNELIAMANSSFDKLSLGTCFLTKNDPIYSTISYDFLLNFINASMASISSGV